MDNKYVNYIHASTVNIVQYFRFRLVDFLKNKGYNFVVNNVNNRLEIYEKDSEVLAGVFTARKNSTHNHRIKKEIIYGGSI